MNTMNGYVLLNKPKGVSSFLCMRHAQKKISQDLGVKKIKMGHAGTLDPLAEGVLLCAVGEGTKMLSHLLLHDKQYIATLSLGFESDTDDDEGEKKAFSPPRKSPPTRLEVEEVMHRFLGKIHQTPPIYSALKMNGKRACDRVRNGELVVMTPRTVEIFSIEILHYSYPILQIRVHCGSGTYIRSLARDIGTILQCGAYLSGLQRTHVACFSLSSGILAENVSLHTIFPFTPEHFSLPFFVVNAAQYLDLCHGKFIDFESPDETLSNFHKILLVNAQHAVVGLAVYDANGKQLRPKSMMQNSF